MKAIELSGLKGFESLRVVDVEKPKPGANEVLIEVKAAGINYAEIELTRGKYPALKPLPFIMGFEAAGRVVELGSQVNTLKLGDKMAALVSSGDTPSMRLPRPEPPSASPTASPSLRQPASRFRV